LKNLPKPLVELRKALKDAVDKAKIDEVEKDAAVVATLVLYKTLVKNAGLWGVG
jgi:protein required for attachment to host cells